MEPIGNATSWCLQLEADAETVSPAVQSLLGELRKLSRTGLTAEELNEAKRYLLGAIPVRKLGTIGSTSSTILESIMQSLEPEGLTPVMNHIRAANTDSANRFIKTLFKPEQSSLVVAGNSTAIKSVRKALSPPIRATAIPAAANIRP
jgi:zinc protease